MAEPWATTTTPPGGMRGPASRPGASKQALGPPSSRVGRVPRLPRGGRFRLHDRVVHLAAAEPALGGHRGDRVPAADPGLLPPGHLLRRLGDRPLRLVLRRPGHYQRDLPEHRPAGLVITGGLARHPRGELAERAAAYLLVRLGELTAQHRGPLRAEGGG